MIDVPNKVEIARKNWYETDCKGLSASVIKDAYERGFNRAYHLMKIIKEPKLMLARDIRNHKVLYIELRGDVCTFPVLLDHIIRETAICKVRDLDCFREFRLEEYNITWRCWTQCPTDEYREATPWTITSG